MYNDLVYVYDKGTGVGYIGTSGKKIIDFKYTPDGVYPNFINNYVWVKVEDTKRGFINRQGVEFFED